MQQHIRPALVLLGLFTLITGVIYPLAVTAVAQALLPLQANGSLVTRNEIIIGSALIGQNWNEDPRYFWSRPSATNYSALPSGGSNLGATSATLRASVQQRAADFRLAHDVDAATALPADLLFASASGLDPHISPEAARLQAARVAAARGLPVITVSELVEQLTETPQFGFLGQPRVNVLLLNLALDELQLGQ